MYLINAWLPDINSNSYCSEFIVIIIINNINNFFNYLLFIYINLFIYLN